MAVLTADISPRLARGNTERRRWAVAAAIAAVLHIGVLLISLDVLHGTGSTDPQPFAVEVSIEVPAPKAIAAPKIEIPQPPRSPSKLVELAASIGAEDLPAIPEIETVARPTVAKLSASTVAGVPVIDPGSSPAGAGKGRGELGAGGDSPLSAGGLDNFTASSGTGGGSGSGKGGGTGTGQGDGGIGAAGSGGGNGRGFGGALNRAADALRVAAPREALRLPGKPIYPRSCRQGLCRGGRACEGSSEWKVFVAAAGGKPSKVECVTPMGCELQNAAIRKYFQQSEFPKGDQACVYVFPVRMVVSDE